MGGHNNSVTRDMASTKRADAKKARNKYKGCYKDYLTADRWQYIMTYAEFKPIWLSFKRRGIACLITNLSN